MKPVYQADNKQHEYDRLLEYKWNRNIRQAANPG